MGWKGGVKISSLPSQKKPTWITDWILTASLSTWKLFLFTYSPQTQKRKEKSDSVFMIVIIREKSKPHHYRSVSQPTYICITIVPIVHWAYGLSLSISSISHLIHLLLSDSLSPFFCQKYWYNYPLSLSLMYANVLKRFEFCTQGHIGASIFSALPKKKYAKLSYVLYSSS